MSASMQAENDLKQARAAAADPGVPAATNTDGRVADQPRQQQERPGDAQQQVPHKEIKTMAMEDGIC